MRYENPLKILEVMRLHEEQGCSQREIANSVVCSKTTVGDILKRCREAKLSYAKAKELTHDELKDRLYPKLKEMPIKDEPDWIEIHERLLKYPRLNLQYIWTEEYRPQNPDGLSYSQFCRRYTKWCDCTGRKVTMVRERKPGKELFIDWIGDTLDLVRDEKSGKLMTAHFFITTLGYSSYPYAEAFPDEKEPNWIKGHVHAFEWYRGTPRILVPDNTKTAITKPNYYDPVVNRAYCSLARHYSIGVIPARIKKPRDKNTVESGAGWLETWLLEWLRGKVFSSFDELNREIRERILELASRPFTEREGSRQSVFDAVDLPALNPLPQVRYEYANYIKRRVPDNYHVEYDDFYYSVPYTLYKQMVTIRATMTMIEVIAENGDYVTLHERRFSGNKYVSKDGHMPEKHRRQREADKRDGDSYRAWAKTIGENAYLVIDGLLKAQRIEETAYKSCMGVLQMGKRHGNEKLERACSKALSMGSITFSAIKRLMNSLPEVDTIDEPTPLHDNLRNPAEFN